MNYDRAALPVSLGLLAAAAVCLAVVLVLLANGHPAAAIALPAIALVVIGLLKAPLRLSASVFLFVALVVDDTRARPYMDIWRSPLYPIGRFLYDGLEKTLGIGGLKIFGVELALGALLAILAALHVLARERLTRPASPLVAAAILGAAAVLLFEIYGVARGGDVRFSMLQMRPMLLTFTSLLLFAYAFQERRDVRLVLGVIVTAAVLRALVGIYFWRAVLVHTPLAEIEVGGGMYIATHGDTVLWVTALVAAVLALAIRPSPRTLLLALSVSPVLFVAIVANNRRLAFVALALSAATIFLVAKESLRRRFHPVLVVLAPILLAYVVAARNATGPWAYPVRTLQSLTAGTDTSADMRDIENYNLVITAKRHPILGSGFGHPYIEESRAISITDFLEAYRYLPHNSLLWLLATVGIVGFLAYISFIGIGIFLSLRVYRTAGEPLDELLGLTAVLATVTFMTQCLGDVGIQSWMGILVLSSLFGAIGGRAVRLGAWPASKAGSRPFGPAHG